MPSQPVSARPKRVKRRRHGYRGYGSPLRHEHAGTIHWGRGFAGVGFRKKRVSSLLAPTS